MRHPALAVSVLEGIGGAIYLVIGVFVAVVQNYFDHLSTLGRLLSAVLAVILWPLLLLGIDIRVGLRRALPRLLKGARCTSESAHYFSSSSSS